MLRRVFGLLLLSSLLLAACGGGSDEGGSTDTGGDGGDGGAVATGVTGVTGATGDGGGGGGIDAAQCAEAANAMAAAAGALPAAFSGTGGDLSQSLDELQAFADAAPDEIRDDMQTIVEGYAKIADAMGDFDPQSGQVPPPDVLAQLAQVSQELDSAEFQAAVENVNAYFASCAG